MVWVQRVVGIVAAALLAIGVEACDEGTGGASPAGDTAAGGDTVGADTLADASAADAVSAVADAVADNQGVHDVAALDDASGAEGVLIHLLGDRITVEGDGVSVVGTVATVTAPGTYRVDGTLSDGRLVVASPSDGTVFIVLAGAAIASATNAPLAIEEADDAVIVVADGTDNRLTDAASYVFPSADVDEPNAALYSKADLAVTGGGTLTVIGRYNDGLSSKDGLVIDGPTLAVTAIDDGIRGKDYLVVKSGTITVDAGGDGLKADNAEDAARGYILLEGGDLDVRAGGDALDAETDALVTGGALSLFAGTGASGTLASDASAKGIKGSASVVIDSGTFAIDATDDAIHSNGDVVLNGGTFTLATGDDGIHADTALEINGGTYDITTCYEGIESLALTINDGTLRINARDDGLNAAGGVDGSGGGWGGPGGGGAAVGSGTLAMNGGYVAVTAVGDGVDVNGSVTMSGGAILVHGPTDQANGPLDYDGSFAISGGYVVAAGSAGMAQAPSASGSTQPSILVRFTASQAAGKLVYVRRSGGAGVIAFAPAKAYQSFVLSSSALVQGQSYDLLLGGTPAGAAIDGLYPEGVTAPGTLFETFTVSGLVTQVGSSGGGPGGM